MNGRPETHDAMPLRLSRLTTAVLALLVEQPSHAYEVWKRFEDRFGGSLYASNSKVYRECRRLLALGMIEEIDDEAGRWRRQPRYIFRATAKGARFHRERIVAELREDPRLVGFRERILSTGRDDPRALLAVVARMEEACLAAAERLPAESATLRERLVRELDRARLRADLDFAKRAREIIGEGS